MTGTNVLETGAIQVLMNVNTKILHVMITILVLKTIAALLTDALLYLSFVRKKIPAVYLIVILNKAVANMKIPASSVIFLRQFSEFALKLVVILNHGAGLNGLNVMTTTFVLLTGVTLNLAVYMKISSLLVILLATLVLVIKKKDLPIPKRTVTTITNVLETGAITCMDVSINLLNVVIILSVPQILAILKRVVISNPSLAVIMMLIPPIGAKRPLDASTTVLTATTTILALTTIAVPLKVVPTLLSSVKITANVLLIVAALLTDVPSLPLYAMMVMNVPMITVTITGDANTKQ
jgi:hypothetical protein